MNGGDTCVMRNGRSTSKISIYDYPEHLNPFYEDENHKRLRFWKLGKNKNGETRRSNFSLDGLRDIWTFKSFRSKKKSSTLGINKTSESPTCLRRDISPVIQHYGTYDPKLRHTTNGFDRNVPYRSSLQDMRASQTIDRIGFNRNDRYRSTVQTQNPATGSSSISRRYVYGGSVTPQPCRSTFDTNSENGYMSRGSSQSSVYSTNPFEEDDNNDVVLVPGSGKRPQRKKRRAPPPPTSQVNQIKEESPSQEVLEISNLAAQIESFVNTNNEEDKDITKPVFKKLQTPPPLIIVEEYKEPDIETERKLEIAEEPSVDVKVAEKEQQVELVINENVGCKKVEENETTIDPKPNGSIPEKKFEETEKLSKATEEKQKEEPSVIFTNTVKATMITPPRREKKQERIMEKEQKELNIKKEVVNEVKVEPQNGRFVKEASLTPSDDTNISIDLRICESKDDLTSEASDVSNYKVSYTPLKDSSPELESASYSRKPDIPVKPINLENSSSRYYSDDNLNESIYRKPTRKFHDLRSMSTENGPIPQRRSVKDIIESINKSQSLLKMNQPEPPPTTDHNANQAFKTLEEREKEIKKMLEELEKPLNSNLESTDKDLDDLVDSLNNNVSINNNNIIFQKCVVKKNDIRQTREQSPTVSNLDWNPIPKPKRSKNFN